MPGMKGKCHFLIVHSVLPVLAGGTIYLCWRSPTMLMFRWFSYLGLDAAVEHLRSFAAPAAGYVPGWVLFSSPDALWVYALTAFTASLWLGVEHHGPRLAWLSAGLIFGAGGELGQLFGLVPGTFDTIDFALCLLAFAGALAATKSNLKKGRLAQAATTP
jgi:hypothetical protein